MLSLAAIAEKIVPHFLLCCKKEPIVCFLDNETV